MATLLENLPDILHSVADGLAADILPRLKSKWPDQERHEATELLPFEARLEQRWRSPFDGLAMMLTITRELSMNTGKRLQESPPEGDETLVGVIVRLHARACQVTAEILTLLRAGFADAAMARWRTLHEIAVTSMFIRDGGNPAAQRYVEHEAVESLNAMRLYQEHAAVLGFEKHSPAEVDALTKHVEALLLKYGKPFRSQYGWASEGPTDEVRSFEAVLKKLQLDKWRPYYKMASHPTHANPKGILFSLSLCRKDEVIMLGPTNFGFADPGQNTALSLNQASAALCTINPTLDDIVILKILNVLADETCAAFHKTQQQVEAEENRKRIRRSRK
jgi:hypothetical protein